VTEEEFARCQKALGKKIHENEGVYWESVFPFYCRPTFVYRQFAPGAAKPSRVSSLLGYSHQVEHESQANRSLTAMVLERPAMNGFCLKTLPSKKRNQVRRGLRECEVRKIEGPPPPLERFREINYSQALRQAKGAGAETPPERYEADADRWREQITREFINGGRDWWGAFVGDVLAAYLRAFRVCGVCVIEQTKAHSDYLKFYPMDALYFTYISESTSNSSVRRIINGRPLHASLNRFKEQFGFQSTLNYYYSSSNLAMKAGKLALSWRRSR
jgi:hypothetical protein